MDKKVIEELATATAYTWLSPQAEDFLEWLFNEHADKLPGMEDVTWHLDARDNYRAAMREIVDAVADRIDTDEHKNSLFVAVDALDDLVSAEPPLPASPWNQAPWLVSKLPVPTESLSSQMDDLEALVDQFDEVETDPEEWHGKLRALVQRMGVQLEKTKQAVDRVKNRVEWAGDLVREIPDHPALDSLLEAYDNPTFEQNAKKPLRGIDK